MKRHIILFAAILICNRASADQFMETIWQTGEGSARKKISECENGAPCRKIVWIISSSPSQTDRNNSQVSLRSQSLVGATMLWGFSNGEHKWSNRKIYNPKDGKTYKPHIVLRADGKLNVQGCFGPFLQIPSLIKDKLMTLIARILLSLVAIHNGLIPPIVDLTASHAFHIGWPPHARFHMVWLLGVSCGFASYVAFLIWAPSPNRENRLKQATIPATKMLSAFFAATFSRTAYDGSLSDPKHQVALFGIDGNLLSLSTAALLQLIATFIVWWPTHSERQR